jgi:type II secretory pathway predicted ATPase ExeA
MFLDHYGLREQPFGVTPDPRFLYFSPSHREALASLQYGIDCGRGFLGLIARPGMGKTTLLFRLLEKLRSSARTVFLFQTQCDARGFLRCVLADLGVDVPSQDLVQMQGQLNEILIRQSRIGKPFVLVVDEAQNLDDSVLETIRMLSNFETPRAKLMHIVLAGQPQLADKLARPNMVQLRQRLSIISRLTQLSIAETADYISHRLRVAGYEGKSLFTPEALASIRYRSQGIPREINNICFHALTLGFAKAQKTIDASILAEVWSDLNVESLGSEPSLEDKAVRHSYVECATPSARAKEESPPSPPSRFLTHSQARVAAWRSRVTIMTHALSASLSSCSRAVLAWRAIADTTHLYCREKALSGHIAPWLSDRFGMVAEHGDDARTERTNVA